MNFIIYYEVEQKDKLIQLNLIQIRTGSHLEIKENRNHPNQVREKCPSQHHIKKISV